MKKVLSFVAVVALAASFTACKKDYTCTCTATAAGITTTSSATAKLSKKDAEAWCGDQSSETTVAGTTSTTTCSLD